MSPRNLELHRDVREGEANRRAQDHRHDDLEAHVLPQRLLAGRFRGRPGYRYVDCGGHVFLLGDAGVLVRSCPEVDPGRPCLFVFGKGGAVPPPVSRT